MERIVKKSHGHAEAADWAFPPDAKDVRAYHQSLIRNTEASGRPKGP